MFDLWSLNQFNCLYNLHGTDVTSYFDTLLHSTRDKLPVLSSIVKKKPTIKMFYFKDLQEVFFPLLKVVARWMKSRSTDIIGPSALSSDVQWLSNALNKK